MGLQPPHLTHAVPKQALLVTSEPDEGRNRLQDYLLVWRGLLAHAAISVPAPVCGQWPGVQNRHRGPGAGAGLRGLLSWSAAEPALAPWRDLTVGLALRPGIPASSSPRS